MPTVRTPDSEQAELKNNIRPWSTLSLAWELPFPKETWIAIAAAVGLCIYLVLRYSILSVERSSWILAAVLIGGVPLVIDLAKKALAGEFGSDLLAGLSIVTSAVIGEYFAGSIVVLMLSGGTALELS